MKKNAAIEIVLATSKDLEYINNKLVEFNNSQVPFTQQDPFINLNFVIKSDKGELLGGIEAMR